MLFFWLIFLGLVTLCVAAYALMARSYRKPAVRERIHARALEIFHREISPQQAQKWFSNRDLDKVPEHLRPLARLLLSCGEGNKVYDHNSFEIITSGLRKRELLLEEIGRAHV